MILSYFLTRFHFIFLILLNPMPINLTCYLGLNFHYRIHLNFYIIFLFGFPIHLSYPIIIITISNIKSHFIFNPVWF